MKSKEKSKKEPRIGIKAICKMCGKEIEYIGPFWRHLGEWQPRHPALPKEEEFQKVVEQSPQNTIMGLPVVETESVSRPTLLKFSDLSAYIAHWLDKRFGRS